MSSKFNQHPNSITKIATKILRNAQIIGFLIIGIIFFGTLTVLSKSSNSITCRVIETELSNITSQLSREIALGDERAAHELFKHFISSIANIGKIQKITLEINKTIPTSSSDSCRAKFFSVEINHPLIFAGKQVAYIQGSIKQLSLLNIIFTFCVMCLCFIVFIHYLSKHLEEKITHSIIDPILKVSAQISLPDDKQYPDEVREIERNIIKLKQDIQTKEKQNFELQKSKELGDIIIGIYKQVAHDIRSPISALQVVLKNKDKFAPELHDVLSLAIDRIKEIAAELSKKSMGDISQKNEIHVDLLIEAIKKLMTEMKVAYKDKSNLTLSLNIKRDANAINSKLNLNLPAIKRALSNLINNAAEATLLNGTVELIVCIEVTQLHICIRDDGIGMSNETLKKLGERGFSYGKESLENTGSGLGYNYAQKVINELNGNITVTSRLTKGTSVAIKLPYS
ncbi:MAG: sensor histidine kinase [Bdellovibrionota bacterium]